MEPLHPQYLEWMILLECHESPAYFQHSQCSWGHSNTHSRILSKALPSNFQTLVVLLHLVKEVPKFGFFITRVQERSAKCHNASFLCGDSLQDSNIPIYNTKILLPGQNTTPKDFLTHCMDCCKKSISSRMIPKLLFNVTDAIGSSIVHILHILSSFSQMFPR